MVNTTILIGHLGGDVELKAFENGQLATWTMATDESYKRQDGTLVEDTQWHQVSMGGRMAEHCAKYLKKGSKVYVQGRYRSRTVEKEDGKHTYWTLRADEIKFLDKKE